MVDWTPAVYEEYLRRNPGSKIPHAKLECHKAPALGKTVPGKTESMERARVRFTGYRVRPLDPDNFAGSCKDVIDGLRHAGLISGDDPTQIILETEQVKVKHRYEEKTIVEIVYP